MNFLRSNMGNPDTSTVQSAESPNFKNAQAMEEQSPGSSPTYDNVPRSSNSNPFAQSGGFKYDMFGTERPDGSESPEAQAVPLAQRDRRMSKEWDASKVPPSRFQKREGSIHATPASRDGHVERNDRTALFEKLTKGKKGERRKSQS